MSLTPENFAVPQELRTDDFLIRKLCYADAELDFEAVMSSIDIIHKTRGGDWPEDTLTLEEDKIDLAWHQREFEFGNSFAYTVMNPENTKCLGCFYFYPPGFRGEQSAKGDVDVSFWVTQDAYDQGLYEKLHQVIDSWLKEVWPFEKVVYTNEMIPKT